MAKKLKDSLDDLLESLFETKEYKNYKKAEKEWTNSKDSQKLLSEFLKARSTLGIYQQGGFEEGGEQEEKVQELHKKVKGDKNIEKWINEQNNFQNFIWNQAEYISKKLKFPFSKKPSCGGCS
jgi:cell fate (sporulation/competence/biofilm development) regulator YlbF (YheA/YmcA/DUF963 family)